MSYCSYYQANIKREKMWFIVATFRSFEHLLFDRALNKQTCLFEFFVPSDLEPYFLEIIDHCIKQGIVSNLQKLPNRLAHEEPLT
jgi:hypothetical protein